MTAKKKQREKIFHKYGGKCAYCGDDLGKRWHADHLEPVIRCLRTGEPTKPENDNFENMMPACPSCNIDKSSMSLETWRKVIANKINVLNRDVNVFKFAKRFGLVAETNASVTFYFEKDIY